MRFRGGEVHAHDPMPKTPKAQRHGTPKSGDGRAFIDASTDEFYDANVTYAARLRSLFDDELGELLLAHYAYPWLNGYRRMPSGRKVPLRKRHWSYDKWGPEGLRLKRPNGQHTLRLSEALAISAEQRAVPIKECKSRAFARLDRPWLLLDAMCVHHDVPNWCKALTTMWGFKGKVAHAARAGVPLAAIFGKGLRGRARRVARTRVIERGWKDGTRVYATW